jgi:hypothetical protein
VRVHQTSRDEPHDVTFRGAFEEINEIDPVEVVLQARRPARWK